MLSVKEAPVVIMDKMTIHYILPVPPPKNSSKDRRSSSSAASMCAQGLTLEELQ